MGTKTHNNYEDLITFTRASGGHALRPVSYGDELVTNGTFDTDTTGWARNPDTSNVTLSVDSSRLKITTLSTGGAYQNVSTQAGKLYRVTWDYTEGTVSASNVTVRAYPSGAFTGSTNETAATEGYIDVVATGDELRIYLRCAGAGTSFFDNVSVKEVLFDQPDGTLTLFEHPDNIPRVEYDADGNRLGLLVEVQRTNLITQSDASAWTVASATKTVSSATSLSAFTGATGASQGATWHRLRIPSNVSVTSGTTYTVTAFYKYGTSGSVLLNFRDVSGAQESRITGSWGSLAITGSAAGTLTILDEVSLPEGVKKVVVKYVPDFSGSFEFGIGPDSTTSGETVIALAAQVEQASFGSSYIKTTGSTETRSADVATLSFDNFGHNKKEMTLFCDFDYRNWQNSSTYHRAVSLGRSTTSTNVNFGVFNNGTSSGAIRYRVDNSSGTAVLSAGDLSGSDAVTSAKVALAVKEGQHAITYNGNTPVTSTGGDPELETVDVLAIGARWAEASQAVADYGQCHIKSIKYYPRRLTNAQLQEITS